MPSKIKNTKSQTKAPASSKTKNSTTTRAKVTTPITKVIQQVEEASDQSEEEPQEIENPANDQESLGDEESDDADEGVDEEGMTRLMKALGEDGLDDFAKAELEALAEDDEEEEDEEEEDEEDEEEVESRKENVESAEDNEEDEEEQEDVPLDEAESVDEDAVPKQKVEFDNQIAMARIREGIRLDPSIPWTEVLTVSYPETIDVDVDDDLNRELAFYKQALHGAQTAKSLAAKHKLPFTRPSDYFAEMVKSDAHMERIRQRLLDETATIKRSEEKRKEREGKKFGKQVQMEKLKERERSKKDMEERLKGLKRKRKGALDNAQGEDDAFDVAVEDAISDRPSKRAKTGATGGKRGLPRSARDKKFGFGGPGRRAKQNTKASTDNFEPNRGGGHPSRGGRTGNRGGGKAGGAKRPGKSRRMAARSRS